MSQPIPRATTRRRFLTTAAAGTGALLVAGTLPEQAAAGTFIDHTFAGVAAFAVPGNDPFSRQQRLSTRLPGGVDAQAGRVIIETLDKAIPVVVGRGELAAPGALGVALILESLALSRSPLSVVGPFGSPFANLKWEDKRWVLQKLDTLPLLNGLTIEFAGNVIITLAGFGAYGERGKFNRQTGVLTGRPIGWDRSNYGGVSDGWPEFIGYYQDRTEVTG